MLPCHGFLISSYRIQIAEFCFSKLRLMRVLKPARDVYMHISGIHQKPDHDRDSTAQVGRHLRSFYGPFDKSAIGRHVNLRVFVGFLTEWSLNGLQWKTSKMPERNGFDLSSTTMDGKVCPVQAPKGLIK